MSTKSVLLKKCRDRPAIPREHHRASQGEAAHEREAFLAIEIEDQLSDLGTDLENIQETTAKLIDLQRESLQGDD
jgi:hypothetical protein